MTPAAERLDLARVLAYQQPLRSRDLAASVAQEVRESGDLPVLARASWLTALADVRIGDAADAAETLAAARRLFGMAGDSHGERMCDEVRAIALRRTGDPTACRALLDEIDRRHPPPSDDFDAFLVHNSRALTLKCLGLTERTLSHFYAAAEAADRLGWIGPRVVAAANLGGFHLDLYNLEDALTLSRRAQQGALAAEMAPIIGTATANLIVVHWALDQRRDARRLSDFLIGNEHRLIPGALQTHAALIALGFLAGGELRPAQHWLDIAAAAPGASAAPGDLVAWVQARVHLENGDAGAAVRAVDAALSDEEARRHAGAPFDRLELLRAAADACERHGDVGRAISLVRRSQQVHESLLTRSTRARLRALQAESERMQSRRDQDDIRRREQDPATERRRLQVLDEALQAQTQANTRLQAALREQAPLDPGTGLANRGHLEALSSVLLASARRRGQPLAVALIEVDASPGQRVAEVARRLRREVRASDAICRWDADRFVLLMPDTDAGCADQAMRRLRQGLAVGGEVDPAAAIAAFHAGIAMLDDGDADLGRLVVRAGDRLHAGLDTPGSGH